MKCQEVARQLSAYLDGELGDLATSALRGHLRTCDGCRALADAEAKLVESLRQLPALDPPPALWQAVRTQLAEQEIADASAGWWARWWAGAWRGARPYLPGLGGVALVATAAALLWWPSGSRSPAPVATTPTSPAATAAVAVVDVAATLADEAELAEHSYQEATAELLELIDEERASWDAAYAQRHDERVAALKASIAALPAGAERERAHRELMRTLQTALTRAELAMGAP